MSTLQVNEASAKYIVQKKRPAQRNAAESLITQHLDLWSSAIASKNTTGRGSNKKIELYGVKKLRELILELAVRGKLVPQDPNDEPASKLLKRIEDEKLRLVKDGLIKKPKKLPELDLADFPCEIPSNWAWSRIEEFSLIAPRNQAADDLEVAFVPMPLVSTNYKGEHGQEAKLWKEIKTGYTHFADGDIAIAKITPCFENSKAAVFSGLLNGIGAGTTELHVARPYSNSINRLYVLLYLKSPQFLAVGETKMTGSAGQKRVPKDFFARNPIPLPPENEQHRIVAKVDELMALCDQLENQTEQSLDAHATLADTLLDALTQAQSHADLMENWQRLEQNWDILFPSNIAGQRAIDKLKQTILQLAVMGKLVPQDPNDEPASELLKRIAAEKEQLIKDKKIKKQKPLPPITDEERPFELPDGWKWARFGGIANSRLGKMLDKSTNKGKMRPYLRNTNVQWHRFDLSDIKMIRLEEEELDELRLQSGDILICEGGHPGRCAIWEDDEMEMYFQKALHRARPYSGISAKYIQIILTEGVASQRLNDLFTGATIKHLVGAKLNMFAVPLPPLGEQHRIVTKVEELTTLCDQLKQRLQTTQQTQQQFTDAVVAGALR